MERKYIRRRYIINWRFQMRYVVFTVVPIILLGLFAATMGFRVAYEMASTQRQQLMVMISSLEGSLKEIEAFLVDRATLEKARAGLKNLKNFSQDLITMNMLEMRRLTRLMMFAMIVIIGGAVFLGVFFSHRIAGPIFRLQRHIKEMGEKPLNIPIRIRSHDEFQELASSLEQLRQVQLSTFSKRQDSLQNISQALQRIEARLSASALPDKQDIDVLKSELTELKKIC